MRDMWNLAITAFFTGLFLGWVLGMLVVIAKVQ